MDIFNLSLIISYDLQEKHGILNENVLRISEIV